MTNVHLHCFVLSLNALESGSMLIQYICSHNQSIKKMIMDHYIAMSIYRCVLLHAHVLVFITKAQQVQNSYKVINIYINLHIHSGIVLDGNFISISLIVFPLTLIKMI